MKPAVFDDTIASADPSSEAPAGRRPWKYGLLDILCRLAPRNEVEDSVSTEMLIPADPLRVWRNIQFYEEVVGPAPILLRWLLPTPIRTEGTKQTIGAVVRCTYEGGFLIKQITESQPGALVAFDVLHQSLGIEVFVSLGQGSYRLEGDEAGTRVVLNTRYLGQLRPRVCWQPVERWIAHMMHRHILRGMCRHLTEAPGVD